MRNRGRQYSEQYHNLLYKAEKLRRHNKQGNYKTKQRYYEAYKRFLQFVAEEYHLQKIANIGAKHILAYVRNMQDKKLSASTIKTDLAAIRFWHDQIPNPRHTLPKNNELSLDRRQFGGVDRTWSQGELNRIITLCWKLNREDYTACVILGRYAGLRIHEAMRIDTAIARRALQTGILTIKGKGGKIRDMHINRQIEIQFEEFLAKTKPGSKLFVPDNMPTHLANKELERFIYKHSNKIADPDRQAELTFHGLRHTYALEQYIALREKGRSDSEPSRKYPAISGTTGWMSPTFTWQGSAT